MSGISKTVFTIGHSNHDIEKFCALLKHHAITAICDVRSHPSSAQNPNFNQTLPKQTLRKENVAYSTFCSELGVWVVDPSCYEHGRVSYERIAHTTTFQQGLRRILQGITTHRVALMCAEKEPLNCHRTILVARYL